MGGRRSRLVGALTASAMRMSLVWSGIRPSFHPPFLHPRSAPVRESRRSNRPPPGSNEAGFAHPPAVLGTSHRAERGPHVPGRSGLSCLHRCRPPSSHCVRSKTANDGVRQSVAMRQSPIQRKPAHHFGSARAICEGQTATLEAAVGVGRS
jgi:hypothetical protein